MEGKLHFSFLVNYKTSRDSYFKTLLSFHKSNYSYKDKFGNLNFSIRIKKSMNTMTPIAK